MLNVVILQYVLFFFGNLVVYVAQTAHLIRAAP
jgi:hypothetical protein